MTTTVVVIVHALLLLLLLLLGRPVHVTSHGFLSSPRSRNLVAYEDRVYYPQTSDDPEPEDCPACLNRGGGGSLRAAPSSTVCGITTIPGMPSVVP